MQPRRTSCSGTLSIAKASRASRSPNTPAPRSWVNPRPTILRWSRWITSCCAITSTQTNGSPKRQRGVPTTSLRALYNLGLSYEGAGLNDEAAAAYRTAIAWDQDSAAQDPQPYLDLGTLLLQESKPDQALSPLQKAVALAPQNPRAHERLGQAWEQLQDLPKADAEMQAAVSLAPDISSLHFEMGRIFQREGLSAKAKEEFARCAALNAAHSTDSAATPNPAPPNDRQHN
jgi:tetratricopeptide (TPR) repeat protein